LHVVVLAAVVEPRLDLGLEFDASPDAHDPADERVRRVRRRARDRHEILDLADRRRSGSA
jgi:hypothetical protein